MHLRPLHDRIIVQRLEESLHTGAIVIPDSAKEKPQQGKYAGQEVSVDGVDYLIMKEDDVLAIQERSL